jgi:hypothetical protein
MENTAAQNKTEIYLYTTLHNSRRIREQSHLKHQENVKMYPITRLTNLYDMHTVQQTTLRSSATNYKNCEQV